MDFLTHPLVFPALAAVYAARVAFFFLGVVKERRRWVRSPHQPSISIIVPARNEENNIERCVRSLIELDYPLERLEIIIVDDRSTDRTGEVLDQLAASHSFITVLHRSEREVDPNLRGKPGALQYGIEHSHGDVVLMTDADCEVPRQWASAMVRPFRDERVGMVNAMTSVSGETMFDRVQDVEWTYTQSMACGGVGNSVALGCFGNNLAIRRSLFDQLGGYHEIPFSVTEDMALQLAVERAGHRIRFVIQPETSVTTLPCETLAEYLKQRHRWVRGGTGLGLRAAGFVLSGVALWLGIALAIIQHEWTWLVGMLALRLLADGSLIAFSAINVRRHKLLPMIIPSMCILVLTELILPLLALKKQVVWKGQIFKN